MAKTQNEWWLTPPTVKTELSDGSMTLSYWSEVDKIQIKNRYFKTCTVPAEVLLLSKDELIKFIDEVEAKRQ